MHTPTDPNRRRLLAVTAVGVLAGASPPVRARVILASPAAVPRGWGPWDDPRVRQIVGASHGNIGRVRELLVEQSSLAKACWDWGFGDWESPIGAASHTGRREIAGLLMAHGARPTLFTLAMLGNVDAVRAAIEADPPIAAVPGPHSLTLMHHARVGGVEAERVVDYLQTVPRADVGPADLPLAGGDLDRILGVYRIDGTNEALSVAMHKDKPAISYPGGSLRRLWHMGGLEFHPAGAERVSVRFTLDESEIHVSISGFGSPILAKRHR